MCASPSASVAFSTTTCVSAGLATAREWCPTARGGCAAVEPGAAARVLPTAAGEQDRGQHAPRPRPRRRRPAPPLARGGLLFDRNFGGAGPPVPTPARCRAGGRAAAGRGARRAGGRGGSGFELTGSRLPRRSLRGSAARARAERPPEGDPRHATRPRWRPRRLPRKPGRARPPRQPRRPAPLQAAAAPAPPALAPARRGAAGSDASLSAAGVGSSGCASSGCAPSTGFGFPRRLLRLGSSAGGDSAPACAAPATVLRLAPNAGWPGPGAGAVQPWAAGTGVAGAGWPGVAVAGGPGTAAAGCPAAVSAVAGGCPATGRTISGVARGTTGCTGRWVRSAALGRPRARARGRPTRAGV